MNLRDFLGAASKLKESIFKSVQLKVGSSFCFNLVKNIVFVFGKVDAMFLKFYTVRKTSGEFVPQCLACCVGYLNTPSYKMFFFVCERLILISV